MESLKIKIGNTNLEIPIGLIVGIVVVVIGVFLMIFEGITFIEIQEWIVGRWKDFKR